ncbi:39S ribosomal protein L16, mitochondrial [Didymosphaeria variabile]|uniref:39S ribosomal protein L16, mitochondrial n=1 Tax=Didymosphaeria variabile TaxID=1932322 RepID=A0A9W8XPD1_9PLEO|nr:39S ribosomal protein L16, mitochondrial [Didymosphaeria variabile]KAJ4356368.1 39S ribosomal protein L16, mitochondrial [Didymosphaeria variabile]
MSLAAQLSRMTLSASRTRLLPTVLTPKVRIPSARAFSSTPHRLNWLAPKAGESRKSRKGRCRVPTGGSMRGTTVVWGDYGLRMRDHDRRISSSQLHIAEETIKKRLRGMKFRLYERVSANIGVYTSGNESRMGKGKGSFDHWATRLAVSKVVFEIKGDLHEQVVRDAFRLAGNKLPGLWEFVKKGDAPKMGITKVGVNGITAEDLKRPRRKVPLEPLEQTAARLPSASPS